MAAPRRKASKPSGAFSAASCADDARSSYPELFKNELFYKKLRTYLGYGNVALTVPKPTLGLDKDQRFKLSKQLFQKNINTAGSLNADHNEFRLNHIVTLADLSCPGVEQFLVNASRSGYFKAPYRWLLLASDNDDDDEEKTKAVFNNLDILTDSEVVFAKRDAIGGYKMSEVYKISETSHTIKLPRGYWYPNLYKDDKTKYFERNSNNGNSENIPYNTSSGLSGTNTKDLFVFDSKNIKNKNLKTIDKTVKIVDVTDFGVFIDSRDAKIVSKRRHDLMGHPLVMANVLVDSNETKYHLDDRLNLHQDSITKVSSMVVSLCFGMLNATELRVFTNTWGYRDPNGNWQGVIDLLLKKKADLGTQTIFTKERMETVDYIAMVGTTGVRFVFRQPPLSYVSNIFYLPFTARVWFAIFICILGCSLFLYITSKWEATMGMHPLQLDGSWADVLILIIGAALQQGCTLEPRYAAGRCVTLFAFLTLTILYAAYSANIVVLLRASSTSEKTLSDLLNSPLKMGASDFEYNRYFFKKLNDPIRKDIYNKKIAPKGKKPNFYSMKEGIEKIRQGLFAFHMETNPGYRIIQDTYKEDEKCDLVEIDFINEINPWVPGQKRSPFKELFKINFLRIRESGIQTCIHHRINVPRPHCSGTIATFSSVGLVDVEPALMITLYGFLLAPALLVCEFLCFKLEKQRLLRKPHIPWMQ